MPNARLVEGPANGIEFKVDERPELGLYWTEHEPIAGDLVSVTVHRYVLTGLNPQDKTFATYTWEQRVSSEVEPAAG